MKFINNCFFGGISVLKMHCLDINTINRYRIKNPMSRFDTTAQKKKKNIVLKSKSVTLS